ncbi:MAG: YbfB/YjiJ family MFS transporter [Salaquimonas sp.]|nr:YbfB/YjiJ family MFS transporter [Salaquimonas sp.]
MRRRSFSPALLAAIAGMLAMATVMGIGRFVYTPILPSMIASGTLDASEAGLVAGFNYLGYLLGALAASAGFFAPRRRAWFFMALAGSVATTAAMALADDMAAMIVLRFLSGVASAFSMIFITAIVLSKLAAERREGLIAMHFGGVGAGIAGSAVVVSAMVAAEIPWREIWFASGLVSALFFFLVAWLLPPTERETASLRGGGNTESSSVRLPLALLIVSYGLFGFGYVITATFINAMAKSQPELASVEPYVWIALGLAGIPSVWFWNRVTAWLGVLGTYMLACIAEAFGVALSVTVLSPVALMVSAVLLGGTFIAITSLGLARARLMAPANPAGAIALMTASFGLGQVIGPVIAGWLFEELGNLVLASWIAAAALVASALFALVVRYILRATPHAG